MRGPRGSRPSPAPQPLTLGTAEGRVLQLPLPPVQLLRFPVEFLLALQQLRRGGGGRGLRRGRHKRCAPAGSRIPRARSAWRRLPPYLRTVGAVVAGLGGTRLPRGLRGRRYRGRRRYRRGLERRRWLQGKRRAVRLRRQRGGLRCPGRSSGAGAGPGLRGGPAAHRVALEGVVAVQHSGGPGLQRCGILEGVVREHRGAAALGHGRTGTRTGSALDPRDRRRRRRQAPPLPAADWSS